MFTTTQQQLLSLNKRGSNQFETLKNSLFNYVESINVAANVLKDIDSVDTDLGKLITFKDTDGSSIAGLGRVVVHSWGWRYLPQIGEQKNHFPLYNLDSIIASGGGARRYGAVTIKHALTKQNPEFPGPVSSNIEKSSEQSVTIHYQDHGLPKDRPLEIAGLTLSNGDTMPKQIEIARFLDTFLELQATNIG